jgi:AraC-like DNA-binding protein
MRSFEVAPCPRLGSYVQLIWCLELDAELDFGPPERIAPDGVVELVFHYRDPVAMRFAREELVSQPRSALVTLTRRYVEICPRGPSGFLAVRFRPWGAHHFLRLPVSELADRMVSAGDVWGASIHALEEQLAMAETTGSRVQLVEQFLIARLQPDPKIDAEPIVRAIWGCGGDIRVSALCADLGLTERTLERTFAAAVGMAPRSFIRLTRFLRSCSRLRSGAASSLTAVALDGGYYDQAHFIADVKAFSGMTPGELLGAPAFSFLEPG